MLLKKKFIISPFGELIQKIQVQEFKKNKMHSISTKIPKKAKKPGSLQPVLPLIPEKLPFFKEDKSNFVSFELNLRVGTPNYSEVSCRMLVGTHSCWADVGSNDADVPVLVAVFSPGEEGAEAPWFVLRLGDDMAINFEFFVNCVKLLIFCATAWYFLCFAFTLHRIYSNRQSFL